MSRGLSEAFLSGILLAEQCCHFVEFLWHANGQTQHEKKITSISSFSPIITAGSQAWVCVCVHSEGVWFSQTCLAYRLCLSLRDGIFCHPAVWILILYWIRVMESRCSPDWHDSQPSRQLLPWPVCLLWCHLPLTNSTNLSTKRGRMVKQNRSIARITPLQSFIHCCSLCTQLQDSFTVR